MTIDSNTIEWIENNTSPDLYDSYEEFFQNEIAPFFDGRYISSSGFRPFIREFFNKKRESFEDKLFNYFSTLDRQISIAFRSLFK